MLTNKTSITTLSAEKAAQVILPALRRESSRGRGVVMTVADAAAHTGLPLREAESGLHLLSARYHGHLSVTEQGTLLFKFAHGLKTDWQRRGRVRALAGSIGGALAVLFRAVARMAITVLLVGYAVVYMVLLMVGAIALSIAAEDGSPLEAVFYLWWLIFELVADAFFFTFHPIARYELDARSSRRHRAGSSRRPRRHLYDKINCFFIGVSPDQDDPRALEQRLLSLIRAGHGVIGVSDVMRVTGQERAPAEATLSRLLLDHDGEVEVSDQGAILYRFPALLETAAGARDVAMPPPIWQRPVTVVPFSGNSFSTNVVIVALTCFNGGMGWLGMELQLPFYLAELPMALALGLLCLPLLRIVPVLFSRRRARRENGRRAMLATVLAAAREIRVATHDSLASAWRGQAGRRPSDDTVRAMVIDLGGDIDAGIDAFTGPEREAVSEYLADIRPVDSAGDRVSYRFTDLECEAAALEGARGLAAVHPAPAPAIVFSSDE